MHFFSIYSTVPIDKHSSSMHFILTVQTVHMHVFFLSLLTSWSCAVGLLLEFDCHFLHRTSHTCSPFDVGVLTHVPPPPPLVNICNFTFSSVLDCTIYISHPTLDKKLSPSLCGSLGAISLPNTNIKQIKRKIKLNWVGLASSDSTESCMQGGERPDSSLSTLLKYSKIYILSNIPGALWEAMLWHAARSRKRGGLQQTVR